MEGAATDGVKHGDTSPARVGHNTMRQTCFGDEHCCCTEPSAPPVCMYDGHTYIKRMDQPGKVANPAHGQLNREN